MEGSSTNRDAKNYELLAYYYDSLLSDRESFGLWLAYIEEKPFRTVLDLGAGSAIMAAILANKGYDVVASDISRQMKEAAAKNFKGEYLVLDMTDYHLDRKFDLIICLVDSINYLQEDELDSFFICAKEHLNQNGRLLFDMHHPCRLEEFADEYLEEGHIDDIDYLWSIESDPYDRLINTHFTFYTPNGMVLENHTQHVFDCEMIQNKMEKAGFAVRIIDDFVEEEKILVIGEKR